MVNYCNIFSRYSVAPNMLQEIPKSTRVCHLTKREFEPNETFYSILYDRDGELLRLDFSLEAWKKPADGCLGWWRSKMPAVADKKVKLAPNDILLNLFDSLADQDDKKEMRYVLTLLLIRRRLFRLEKGAETDLITVYCPKRDMLYSVPVATPEPDAEQKIQETLVSLLFS